MEDNPLSSLIPQEQKEILDRKMLFSFLIPFKKRKLNQVGNSVKEILKQYNITYPIIFDFNYPPKGSKYGIALIDSDKFMEYTLFIHYNSHLISMDFNQLVLTGLHEYSHIIYRQREYFSLEYFNQLFPKIDHQNFVDSIDQLTNKLLENNILKVPKKNEDLLKDPKIVSDYFAEGFAWYLAGLNEEVIMNEKKNFEKILNIHIQIMKEIRRIKFYEI